jgi:NAD(P)-dependent dehydrogenase (short-subunit alcohol dehydrogenase family)
MSEKKPVALVTDAHEFIGPALTALFAARGVTVVAADPAFADKEVAAAFKAGNAHILPVAQTTPAETLARVLTLQSEIDILCAGGAYPAGRTPADALAEEATRPFFEKLTIEPLAFAAGLVEGMKARGYGRIVFITSAGPVGGIPNYTAYASARAALNGAVRSLAVELAASGISVNAVAPNFIATEAYFPKALIEQPDVRAKILSRVPAKRFGEPDEAAHAVAFFALDPTRFVTGQVMTVSGGWA